MVNVHTESISKRPCIINVQCVSWTTETHIWSSKTSTKLLRLTAQLLRRISNLSLVFELDAGLEAEAGISYGFLPPGVVVPWCSPYCYLACLYKPGHTRYSWESMHSNAKFQNRKTNQSNILNPKTHTVSFSLYISHLLLHAQQLLTRGDTGETYENCEGLESLCHKDPLLIGISGLALTLLDYSLQQADVSIQQRPLQLCHGTHTHSHSGQDRHFQAVL